MKPAIFATFLLGTLFVPVEDARAWGRNRGHQRQRVWSNTGQRECPTPCPLPIPPPPPNPDIPLIVPDGKPEFDPLSLQRPLLGDGQLSWDAAYCMSRFSELAYLDKALASSQLKAWGFTSRYIAAGSMVAHVAWNDEVIIVAFRGTNATELDDWIINLTFDWLTLSQGRVHQGWYAAFKTLESGILAALPTSDKRHRTLWITGHSLGGALAAVCAYSFRERGIDVDSTVTFGQPMLADPMLATFLGNQNRGRFIRFVNDQDIVTKIPPSMLLWPYTHFGTMAWFRDGSVDIRARASRIDQQAPSISNQAFPPGQRALTPGEFERLKQVLRDNREHVNEKHGALETTRFRESGDYLPMISDHGMDRYIAKVRTEMIRARGSVADLRAPRQK